MTFDFQTADLRAVLRTFADISGLNIVIDPTIQGTVDVSLKEVPWDQALDIILKANKLGYTVDGTVVRIAPLAVLADEEAQRRKLAEAQALSGELRVLTRPLSYAKAQDLVPIVTSSALSQRGEVQVDARTNTLIIRDLPDRLTAANDLIGTLDSPQPQVEIEARIVQTSRDFARALGVQWGVNGQMSPALGNTTGAAALVRLEALVAVRVIDIEIARVGPFSQVDETAVGAASHAEPQRAERRRHRLDVLVIEHRAQDRLPVRAAAVVAVGHDARERHAVRRESLRHDTRAEGGRAGSRRRCSTSDRTYPGATANGYRPVAAAAAFASGSR